MCRYIFVVLRQSHFAWHVYTCRSISSKWCARTMKKCTVVLGPSQSVSHIFHSQFVILSCPSRGPHGKRDLIGFLPCWAVGGAPSRFSHLVWCVVLLR